MVAGVAPLVNSPNTLLYPREGLKKEMSRPVPMQGGMESLMAKLKREGPFIAFGPVGPAVYVDEPFLLGGRVGGKEIYGWRPGAKRRESAPQFVLVLGARRVDTRKYVYFTPVVARVVSISMAEGLSFTSSDLDRRIYVTAHRNFASCLVDRAHPERPPERPQQVFAFSSAPRRRPVLTSAQKRYVTELENMRLSSILDKGRGEARCKALGQKIFDEHKRERGSQFAREAVKKVCNALHFLPRMGPLRKQCVERAWNGIGDENWRWRA